MSVLRTVMLVVLGLSTVVQAMPNGAILYATRGTVERYTPDGQHQTLMKCEQISRFMLLVPPYSEQTEQQPCSMSGLVTHVPTGRWAVSVSVTWAPTSITALDLRVDGRSVTLPTRPDGKHVDGSFIVWGDQSGTKGVSHGVASSWYVDGVWDSQVPAGFTERGDALIISAAHSTERGAGPRHVPEALRVDFATGAERMLKLPRGKTVEFCVGAWSAFGLVEERLMNALDTKDLRSAVPVSEDEVVTYIKGRAQQTPTKPSVLSCDPLVSPGSWRRRNLRTGRDEVILNDESCYETNPLPIRTMHGDAVFLRRVKDFANEKVLYRYTPSSGAVRVVTGQLQSLFDVSPDGEEFIGNVYGVGFGVFDAHTGEKRWGATIEHLDTMSSAGFVAY